MKAPSYKKMMLLGVVLSVVMVLPVFAEPAPVYDADTMPQQFDTGPDQDRDLPPPPPPGQEGAAFVPSQTSDNQTDRTDSQSDTQTDNRASSSLSAEQRVRRVEQQIINMQNNDASARVDSLQSQLQSLRDQVEQLTHQLQQAQDQQKTMYTDLDKRLVKSGATATKKVAGTEEGASNDNASAAAETKAGRKAALKLAANNQTAKTTEEAISDKNSGSSAAKSLDEQPNVAEEQQIYQTAYNFIKAKKYEEAVNTLQGMLKKYPSGQFASNAHYWLGELYNLMNKNDRALEEFAMVVKNYSDSPRVSDAQLKIGLIYATQLKWPDAKTTFKQVINHYPGTASARLAAEQLKQIKTSGH